MKKRQSIPLLEVSLSFFSIYAAILMFLYPNILDESSGVYENMTAIVPQTTWAVAFLLAALVKVVGLVLKRDGLRRLGLLMSALIYGGIAFSYVMEFPNLGAGVFFIMSAMAMLSMFYVKHTEL